MSDVLVVCYHAVSERWPADLSVTPEQLEEQLAYLLNRGYRGLTFFEAASAPPAAKTLAVTFDDAYRSVIKLAYPILSRLGLPGTVFVPTNFVGKEGPMTWPGIEQWLNGPYESEMKCMSWQELGRLADAGWEIGSHTKSHPHLTRIDDVSLGDELRGSREECERHLGRPCRSLAYPYGDVDSRVLEATRKVGYQAAAGLPDRFGVADRYLWPRVGIYRENTRRRFRFKVSRVGRRLRESPAWSVFRSLRGVVRRAS